MITDRKELNKLAVEKANMLLLINDNKNCNKILDKIGFTLEKASNLIIKWRTTEMLEPLKELDKQLIFSILCDDCVTELSKNFNLHRLLRYKYSELFNNLIFVIMNRIVQKDNKNILFEDILNKGIVRFMKFVNKKIVDAEGNHLLDVLDKNYELQIVIYVVNSYLNKEK